MREPWEEDPENPTRDLAWLPPCVGLIAGVVVGILMLTDFAYAMPRQTRLFASGTLLPVAWGLAHADLRSSGLSCITLVGGVFLGACLGMQVFSPPGSNIFPIVAAMRTPAALPGILVGWLGGAACSLLNERGRGPRENDSKDVHAERNEP